MKKLLVVLSLAMAVFSFQASAATLSWVGVQPGSTASSTSQILSGDFTPAANGPINHTWTFNLSSLSQVNIGITGLPANWLKTVSFSGGALDLTTVGNVADVWSFHGVLAAGEYTINLIGNVLNGRNYDLRVETPIPAAVWLFGSALMGLMGVSRRKTA